MSRDSESQAGPRQLMTRTFLARMVAILLFVALGTFAVFKSIGGDLKKLAQNQTPKAAESGMPTTGDKTVDATALTATLKATPVSAVQSPAPGNSSASAQSAGAPAANPAAQPATVTPNPVRPAATELPRFNASQPLPGNAAPANPSRQDNPSAVPPAKAPAATPPPSAQPSSQFQPNLASQNPATPNLPAANPRAPASGGIPELARPAQPGSFPAAPQGTSPLPAKAPDQPTGNPQANNVPAAGERLANAASQVQGNAQAVIDEAQSALEGTTRQVQTNAGQLLNQIAGQPAGSPAPASAAANPAAGFAPPAGNPGATSSPQSSSPAAGAMLPPGGAAQGNFAGNAPLRMLPDNGVQVPDGGRVIPGLVSGSNPNQPSPAQAPVRPNQLPGQANPATNGQAAGGSFAPSPLNSNPSSAPGVRPGAIPAAPASTPLSQPGFATAAQPPGRTPIPGAAPQPVRTLDTPGEARLEGPQTPSLAVEKQAPREIQLNQPAEFRIIVRNTGRVPASDVRVFDSVPAGTRLVSSDPPHESASTPDGLMWPLGELQPGDEKTITLRLNPERPGEIGSVAHVTFATQASMRTRVTRPQISIEHTAPAEVMIGQPVPLQITVRNNGDGPATHVVIQEKVPEQFRYSEGIRDLEYEVGTLAPGQSRSVTLTLQAVGVGESVNVVGAVADGGLQTSHEARIAVVSPKLAVASDGPNRRFLKRTAAHSFTVQNSGTAAATNVELVSKLPRNVRFVAANNQGQYDPGSHAVYWSLAELRAGQTASVEMQTEPVETGSAQIEFVARADLDQQTALQHPLTIEHLVDVHFEIEDLTDHIEVGAKTEYRLRLVNQGTRAASNVRLRAELAEGLRAEAVTGGLRGTANGQEVLFEPIPNINPGEEITAVFSAIGTAPGEHRVAVNLQTDGRELNITKEESTRVYADQ